MNLKIASVAKYAEGNAPLSGIPIAGVGTIALLRRHLQTAIEIRPVRIIYNMDTKIVTLRNHRAVCGLNDLLGEGEIKQKQIRDQLRSWTNGKRSAAHKRKQTAGLGEEGVYLLRKRKAIVSQIDAYRAEIAHVAKESEAAQTALDCQDACNLSGVLVSFEEIVHEVIWPEAQILDKGPDLVNSHPIVTLFLSKIYSLNRSYYECDYLRASDACEAFAPGETT